MKRLYLFLISLLLVLNLGACGGGGGGNTNPTTTGGSSNWDQMRWDQDNWT